MKKSLLTGILFLIAVMVFGQDGFRIAVKIHHYPDTSLLLTTYYGDKIRVIDTAFAKHPGEFLFSRNKPLEGGIYMAVSPEKVKLFEFVVNHKNRLNITADTADYTASVKVKNSPENSVFYDYLRFNDRQYKQIKHLIAAMDTLPKKGAHYAQLKRQVEALNKKSVAYKEKVIQKHPDLFITKVLDGMRDVEVPSDTTTGDSLYAYHYLKKHFWDHFDLSDNRLLHTPLYSKKVKEYFNRLVPLNPDSVIKEIDRIIAKARPSNDNVSWLVWHFTAEYQNPKFMGFDKVFVHLVDRYFTKEKIENTTASINKVLKERADKLRPLLIGKPAPELTLMDTAGNYIDFKSIPNQYTLLLFWDYKCGICKREIKELKKYYKNPKYDIEVYGIDINPDLKKWKKAVHDRKLPWINVNGTHSAKGNYNKLYDIHGTPVIYLLDKNKIIIAKQLSADHINDFLDHYKP